MLPWLVCGVFVAVLYVLFKIVTLSTDPVLTAAQLESEGAFLDEHGVKKQFPRLVQDDTVSKATLHLSVVIPAYNERERLPGMLDDAIATLTKRTEADPSYTWEIIVVDDGSRDKIHEVVAPFVKRVTSERLRLMHLAVNQGKGGAVRKGALVARGAFIYMADADLAATAAELTKIEAGLQGLDDSGDSSRFAIAVGSRAHLKDDSVAKRKWYRTILMHGFHALVWFVGGVRDIEDTQCGYKLFTRDAAAAIFHSIQIRRWAFDVEVLRIAQWLNIPIAEVAINWSEIDGSKLDLKGMITMAKDLFRMRIMYVTGVWKVPRRLL